MTHQKCDCVIFREEGLPCEDCDLEGHSRTCGWHKDWHDCNCGAFDKEEEPCYCPCGSYEDCDCNLPWNDSDYEESK